MLVIMRKASRGPAEKSDAVRLLAAGLVLVTALFGDTLARSAPETSTPGAAAARSRKLVRQMIAAAGGMERWNSMRNATFVVREVHTHPTSRASITIRRVMITKDPVPMVRIVTPRGRSLQTAVFDGEQIWLAVDGILQEHGPETDARVRNDAKRAYYWFSFPFLLVDPSVVVRHRGTVQLQSGEKEVIEVTFRDDSVAVHAQDMHRYYVDPGTHLVAKEEYSHAGDRGAPTQIVWGDYRLVDGFVKDHVREMVPSPGRAAKRLEVADMELGVGVSPGSFRRPGEGEMPSE